MAAQATRPTSPNHRRSMLDQEVDPNKFDTRTHLFDNQGRLVKKNHYTLYVVDGEQFYERPVGSGNLWYANNRSAGRVLHDAAGKRTFNHTAEHITFVPKLEGHEAIEFELFHEKEKSAALEKELSQIKADFEARLARLEGSNLAPSDSIGSGGTSNVLPEAIAPRLRADKSGGNKP
jgi:hypothetical protein